MINFGCVWQRQNMLNVMAAVVIDTEYFYDPQNESHSAIFFRKHHYLHYSAVLHTILVRSFVYLLPLLNYLTSWSTVTFFLEMASLSLYASASFTIASCFLCSVHITNPVFYFHLLQGNQLG